MRVVESLAMLTAAGYMDFTDHAIVPILFDPDEHNGNKLRTEEVLRAYKKIHRFAGKKGFFSHPVQPLIANKNLINIHKIDYFNKYDNNGQEPFKKDDELGKLTQSLFGLPHHNQITHVNRARLAMGDLASQQNLCDLLRNVKSNDRFVIIGSLCGCTGTSVLFSFTNTLDTFFPEIRKAAIMVMPYFDDPCDWGEMHVLQNRTQQMIRFFSDINFHQQLNRSYLISAQSVSKIQPADGGQMQTNPCCISDIIAATAIADFVKAMVQNSNSKKGEHFVFNMEKHSDAHYDTQDLLSTNMGKSIVACLAKFAMAAKYLIHEQSAPEDDQTNDLVSFMVMFKEWVKTMENVGNGNDLHFLNMDDNLLNNTVYGTTVFITTPKPRSFFFKRMKYSTCDLMDYFKTSMKENRELPLAQQLYICADNIYNTSFSL